MCAWRLLTYSHKKKTKEDLLNEIQSKRSPTVVLIYICLCCLAEYFQTRAVPKLTTVTQFTGSYAGWTKLRNGGQNCVTKMDWSFCNAKFTLNHARAVAKTIVCCRWNQPAWWNIDGHKEGTQYEVSKLQSHPSCFFSQPIKINVEIRETYFLRNLTGYVPSYPVISRLPCPVSHG